MLEVIAPMSIKDAAGIKNDDRIKVQVHVQMP
jgi:CTP-dependent riboflavin kinase